MIVKNIQTCSIRMEMKFGDSKFNFKMIMKILILMNQSIHTQYIYIDLEYYTI